MGLALRIETHGEAAAAPSGAMKREDVHRRLAIEDDRVLADAEGAGVLVVVVAAVVAGAVVAVVVVEAGAREEVGPYHENPQTQFLSFGIEGNSDAIDSWKARRRGRRTCGSDVCDSVHLVTCRVFWGDERVGASNIQ